MSRYRDSGQIDLAEVFYSVQEEMLAQLAVGGNFEHPSAAGTASERHWLDLFDRYLPKRYRAAPAFVIDSEGHRSRQIDIAIFDNLYSPLLFPHKSGLHIPAESIYAVFEVKPTFSKQWLRDAAEKAASVRDLHRTRAPHGPRLQPILAGLLAADSVWSPPTFAPNLRRALTGAPQDTLNIGCCLQHGSFERNRTLRISSPKRTEREASRNAAHMSNVRVSSPEESLIFFVLRLLERLRAMGPAPAIDLMQYARSLQSFK